MPIEISKMIAHKLNINDGMPILSDHCIDIEALEKPQEALDFFVTHIERSRANGFVKKCQFSNLDKQAITIKNRIVNIIANIEDSENFEQVFITESIEMTKKLATIMKSSSSKSDGSLFVILYSIDGQNFIGLMKMDPDSGVEVLDDLTIKVRDDMLPSKKERLHKAAFIICKDDYIENETHLYVLDRQKSNEEGAKFFLDTFLDSKILPTDDNLTVAYQKELVRILKEELPRESFMEFNRRFKRRLSTGVYFTLEEDIPPLLRDLLPEKNRDQELDALCTNIQESLLKSYPGEVTGFTPVVDKINNFVYQSNDRSIKVEITSDAEADLYHKKFMDDGTFVLTVFPDAGMDEIK